MKPIVGLCGGIGAGKSTVAGLLAEHGALVIASDELNHQILKRPEVARQLAEWWGAEVLQPDGAVDRGRVAQRIFEQPAERERLERLVYPLIAELREDMIKRGFENPAVTIIVLDSPLLFESNLDRRCDKVVFVETGEDRRRDRLIESRGWNVQELERRARWQLPVDAKRARSDFILRNDGSLADLRRNVTNLYQNLVGRDSSVE